VYSKILTRIKKTHIFLSSLEDNGTDLEEEAKWANLLSDSDFEG
jgi:hypothetical protein